MTVTWDDRAGRYVLRNHSPRPVRVCFRTWATLTETPLAPWETREVQVPDFEYPFSATFV